MRCTGALGTLLLFVIAGCGGGGGDGASRVQGTVVKGNLSDATVEVWAVGDNGAPQRRLATTNTDANGRFSVSISGYSGWTEIRVSGGTYTDEATGSSTSIPVATPLMGVAYANAAVADNVVTPITTLLTCLAQESARDPGMSFDQAVENATVKISVLFGIDDALATVPADLTAGNVISGQEARYGAILAGYSEAALGYGANGAELSWAVARDSKDGRFDGLEFSVPVEVRIGTPLSPDVLAQIGGATIAWLDSNPNNASGLGSADLPSLASINASDVPVGPRIQTIWNGYSQLTGANVVRVEGLNFGTSPGVTVNGVSGSILSSSDTEVRFLSPTQSSAGDYDVELTGDLGLKYTFSAGVRYYDGNARPSVSTVEPAEGPRCGGTAVRIGGTNLDPNTRVFFGSEEATVVGGNFPHGIVAISPQASSPGSVDLRVENGSSQSVTLPGRYQYKDKNVGREFDESSFASETHTAIFMKQRFDAGGGFEVVAGTQIWDLDGAGQGTFTREQMTMSATVNLSQTFTGGLFYTAEGQNAQILTVDSGTNATNLYAGSIHLDSKTMSGLTASGSFVSYRHGTGLTNLTLRGEYGIAGDTVTLTPSLTFSTFAGTMEFDGAGNGGLSVEGYEREGEGSGFRRYTWAAPFSYSVSPDGAVDLQLDPEAAIPIDFGGRVTPDGGFMGLYYSGTDAWQGEVINLTGARLDDAVAPESLYGEFGGGFRGQETRDSSGSFETEIDFSLRNFLFQTDSSGSRYFVGRDGVVIRFGDEEDVEQEGSVESTVPGPRGRIEFSDGAIGGYYTPRLGYLVLAGRIGETPTFEDDLEYGVGVSIPSYFTKHSLDGNYNVVNAKSYWLDPGTPITGDETNETSLGSVRFNPSSAVTIGGDSFTGFGGFDDLSLTRKAVTRSGLSVTSSIGAFPDLQATWAYGFLNNRFGLFLAERDAASPLATFDEGFREGTGLVSPSGTFGGFVSNAESGTTSFTAFTPQRTTVPSLALSYRFGSSLYDFNGSGATLGTVERGTLSVSGGTSFTQNYLGQTFIEGGTSSTASGTRSGSITANLDGTIDFDFGGGQIHGGFVVGDNGDLILLTDFSTNNQTGITILTRDSTVQPVLYDYGYSSLTKAFGDMNLPAQTTLGLHSGTYTPTTNLLSFIGLDQLRSNDEDRVRLQRRFDGGTASTDSTGGFTYSWGASPFAGGITPDGCFGFGLPGNDTQEPTSMQIGLFLNF